MDKEIAIEVIEQVLIGYLHGADSTPGPNYATHINEAIAHDKRVAAAWAVIKAHLTDDWPQDPGK